MSTITRVNLYRDGSTWCYAAWTDDEHDHNDTLDDADSETDARDAVAAQFPGATITRVADIA